MNFFSASFVLAYKIRRNLFLRFYNVMLVMTRFETKEQTFFHVKADGFVKVTGVCYLSYLSLQSEEIILFQPQILELNFKVNKLRK